MPLRSQMLRQDRTLQACLVSDSAHVVLGSHGPHVAKIQSALLLLDKSLNLPTDELRTKHYGPRTAAAVLEFKRKRKIINFSYQTNPDNIVGKMTIAHLDDEIHALEQRPNLGRTVCRGSTGPIVTSAEPSESFLLVGGQRELAPRKSPAKAPVMTFRSARVAVLFQETDAAVQAGGGLHLLFGQFQKAREMMAPFGIDFAGASTDGIFPLIGPRIPDFEQVISGSPVSTFSVRAAAERVSPGRPGVLRVIFCPFDIKDGAFGVTDGGQCADWNFPKFCLINVRKANPDQGTLLHEMIHASKPERRDHDRLDPTSVFSENIGGRSKLRPEHAEDLAHAFFSSVILF